MRYEVRSFTSKYDIAAIDDAGTIRIVGSLDDEGEARICARALQRAGEPLRLDPNYDRRAVEDALDDVESTLADAKNVILYSSKKTPGAVLEAAKALLADALRVVAIVTGRDAGAALERPPEEALEIARKILEVADRDGNDYEYGSEATRLARLVLRGR